MKKTILLFIILLPSSFLFAQELTDKLTNYFKHHRESMYLHLNKSAYAKGEHVWFQGYVLNRKTNFLSTSVKNAHVQVFNEAGEELAQNLYLVYSGSFQGNFEISDEFEPGFYYLVSQTKRMQYFNESDIHVQAFEVLGKNKKQENTENNAYDFQILPESGHLVDGIKSSIGMKLIDKNGIGVKFEAELYINNTMVSSTKSNVLGMAKTSLTPHLENDYTIQVKLPNGQTIEKKITDIQTNGTVLTVNNISTELININLNFNFTNQKKLKPKDHRLIVHQEGMFYEIPIKTNEKDFNFTVLKKNLSYGVNTLTYFYKNQPVAERLFFHYPPNTSRRNAVKTQVKALPEKDSISAQLKIENLQDSFALMSISILPEESIALTPHQSLASSLYLSPFVKGYIENAAYYFKDITRRKQAELDLLLLTQGWSRYDWENIFQYEPSEPITEQQGVNASLEIKDRLNRHQNQLLINKTTFHESQVYDIPEDKIIHLENTYLIEGESITMSLVGKKKKLQSVNNYNLNIHLNTLDTLLPENAKPTYNSSYIRKKEREKYPQKIVVNTYKEGELLDDVVVKAKINEDAEEFNVSAWGNTIEINDDTAKLYSNLGIFLSSNGWKIYNNASIETRSRALLEMFKVIPIIYLDDRMVDYSEHRRLINMRLDHIESVYMDKSLQYGAGAFELFGAGTIHIKTKSGFGNSTSTSTIVEKGFQPIKEYYMPLYQFYDSPSFQKIGAIDFKTNIATEDGTVQFDFYDTKLPEVIFYIEGITDKGGYIQVELPIVIER